MIPLISMKHWGKSGSELGSVVFARHNLHNDGNCFPFHKRDKNDTLWNIKKKLLHCLVF